jgi:hypothetical protein
MPMGQAITAQVLKYDCAIASRCPEGAIALSFVE